MSHSDQSAEVAYTASVAAAYELDRRGERIWQLEQDHLERELEDAPRGARILDIPIGTGRFIPIYKKLGVQVLGVDIAPAMLAEAKAKGSSSDVTLAIGDASCIAAPDRSFDIVVCFRLLHLLPPEMLDPVIGELARVSSGCVYLQAYVRDKWYWPLRALRLLSRLIAGRSKSVTPWSHIRSYEHRESALIASFAKHGVTRDTEALLCNYGALRVKVYRLRAQ